MKREIAGAELQIWRKCGERIGELILGTVVGTRVEMACCACGAAVAPSLHVPVESFTENYERLWVANVLREVRGLRDFH